MSLYQMPLTYREAQEAIAYAERYIEPATAAQVATAKALLAIAYELNCMRELGRP
jgi:hypothetical protein